jgi:hypothetical protein
MLIGFQGLRLRVGALESGVCQPAGVPRWRLPRWNMLDSLRIYVVSTESPHRRPTGTVSGGHCNYVPM